MNVALVTLDGRAYYRATRLLKDIGISYQSLIPGLSEIKENTLVLTTRGERGEIKADSIIAIEDLGCDLYQARQRLLRSIFGGINHELLVGVDPGKRIGVAAFYESHPVELGIFDDWRSAVNQVRSLVFASPAEIKKIRVGNGQRETALRLVRELGPLVRGKAIIEMVDEENSSKSHQFKRVHLNKDLRAAAVIAFRKGTKLC